MSVRQIILASQLEPCNSELKNIAIEKIKQSKRLFLIAAPDTSREDWTKQNFAVYVDSQKAIQVYLNQETANARSKELNAITETGEPMVIMSPLASLNAMLTEYHNKNLFQTIQFVEKDPFHVECTYQEWMTGQPEAEQPVATESHAPKTFIGVKELTHMFDCNEKAKIANLPSYSYFDQFPQVLGKLVGANHLDPQAIDQELDLVDGLTYQATHNPDIDLSKTTLQAYLKYFGLGAYLYRFAKQSSEVESEISQNTNFCKYQIIPAKISTKERFTLEKITRALDSNKAFLYQLQFKSKMRQKVCVVVSPLGYKQDKDYELVGLDPICDESGENTITQAVRPISDEEGEAAYEKAKVKFEKEQRTYEELRKDYVIRYFKKQNPEQRILQFKEAEKHFTRISEYDDILDEFFWKIKPFDLDLSADPEYQRRREQQPSAIMESKYTADMLQREYRFKTWESYFWLADLRKSPRKTNDMLKYRKTDPQYQTKT